MTDLATLRTALSVFPNITGCGLTAATPLLLRATQAPATQVPSVADDRETVERSHLTGWAGYGYCASHSRRYWGLKPGTSPPCRAAWS